MAIALYPHNENAYHAALAMLRETGKAAVIHPTDGEVFHRLQALRGLSGKKDLLALPL